MLKVVKISAESQLLFIKVVKRTTTLDQIIQGHRLGVQLKVTSQENLMMRYFKQTCQKIGYLMD